MNGVLCSDKHDEDIDMTRNQIQFSVQFMERIMEEGRKAFWTAVVQHV